MLAVPASVRPAYEKKKKLTDKRSAEIDSRPSQVHLLKRQAVRVAVPEAELQPHAVDKAVSNAVLHYARTIASWRERGQEKRADAHEVGA